MTLRIHPEQGTIVICDFNGFSPPEMVKRRPVIIMSPRLRRRQGLCSVVPLSTREPDHIEIYHHRIHIHPPLPKPYDSKISWVKADMIYTVSFDRLTLPFVKKNDGGKREYDVRVVDKSDLIKIQYCLLHALGMSSLTDNL